MPETSPVLWACDFLVGGFASEAEALALKLHHELQTRMQADAIFIQLLDSEGAEPSALPHMVESAIQTAPGGAFTRLIRYEGAVTTPKPH